MCLMNPSWESSQNLSCETSAINLDYKKIDQLMQALASAGNLFGGVQALPVTPSQ